jgi:hypothetical protein
MCFLIAVFIRNIESDKPLHKRHPFRRDIPLVLHNTGRTPPFAHQNRDDADFQYFQTWRQNLTPIWLRTYCFCTLARHLFAEIHETCLSNVDDGWLKINEMW